MKSKPGALSVSVFSALAAGLVATATAAPIPPGAGETVDFDIVWLSGFGQPTPFVFGCNGLPQMPLFQSNRCEMRTVSVATDGGGRIEGVGFMKVFFDISDQNYVELVMSLTGNMSTKNNASSVTLRMTGTGRSQGGGDTADATASVKFVGTVQQGLVDRVSAQYIVTVATNTVSETNSFLGYVTNGSPILNGTNFVSAYETNTITKTNTYDYVATGNVTGNVKTGLKSYKIGTIKNQSGRLLPSGSFYVVDSSGTNLAQQQVDGLIINSLDVSGTLLRRYKKLNAAGDFPFTYQGTGTMDTNKNTYKATLTGLAWGKGSSLNLHGTASRVTNGFITIGTNPPEPIIVAIPGTAAANGKAYNQKVNLTNGIGTIPVPVP